MHDVYWSLLVVREPPPQPSSVYAWVPRERNQLADKLSKRWDYAWSLTDRATSQILNIWPGVRIVCNRFNTIGWLLRNRHTERPEPIILVYPHWSGQAWWPTLHSLSARTINIRRAFDCFLPTWDRDPVGVGKPPWRMHAALLT
jgi:hypothetical protein